MSTKCLIGACIYNAEEWLSMSLNNLDKIKALFPEYKIVFSYDDSTDNSLKILSEYQNKDDRVKIIINNAPLFSMRSVNIATARNKILKELTDEYFMIMLDMNYTNIQSFQPEILTKYLYRDDWDCLTFNRKDYYDIWALSIKPYYISMWHWEKPDKVKGVMKDYIENTLKEMPDDRLLKCISAFGGFGIYKVSKFKGCKYTGLYDLDPFFRLKLNLEDNRKILKSISDTPGEYKPVDCEHKYFHMEAIEKHKARIRICKEILFV
tara:strand:+ start:3935 stop:4729 length:795 start_codon:yes stop_codon:yes gene_type:complete